LSDAQNTSTKLIEHRTIVFVNFE